MSEAADSLRHRLGIPQHALATLEDRQIYDSLHRLRGYLLKKVLSNTDDYFEVDKYTSGVGEQINIYVAPARHFRDASGGRLQNHVRVMVSQDDVEDEDRTLVCDDFLLDPVALGEGIKWRQQVVAVNAYGQWPCLRIDAPKVIRYYDKEDSYQAPANLTVRLGRSYEESFMTGNPIPPSERQAAAERLGSFVHYMDMHNQTPLGDVRLIESNWI